MNKKSLLLLLPAFLSLASCNPDINSSTSASKTSTNSENSTTSDINFDEDGDDYVDETPKITKDGAILHCFNWTYNSIKENLATIAANGFKSVQVSPVQEPKSGGAQWWAYYQPLSLSVANSTPLGTKDELGQLCKEAEKYGISVIADIVVNHLANKGDKFLELDGTPVVSEDVAKFEPEIYELRNDKTNPTFHHNKDAKGSGAVTQYYPFGHLPDLNTANPIVQDRVYSLLKECIDLGIDGFRFDAAKHIETPDDPDYASDFWPNTLGKAKNYYYEQTGSDLFAYGEVLNEPEGGRTIDMYTKFMYVTDSGYVGSHLSKFISGNAEGLVNAGYHKNTDPENLITWIESHDTYVEAKTHQKLKRVRRMWATLASRKGSRGLFFARPDKDNTVANIGDYSFEDEIIACANRFHNRFINADESQFAEGKFYINQRFEEKQCGAVIVSLDGKTEFATTKMDKLANGLYFDQITGQSVKVVDGSVSMELDASGVAILTMTRNLPRPEITLSDRKGAFAGTKIIKVTLKNFESASYTINGGKPIVLTGDSEITIGDVVDSNKNVNIIVTAKNGKFETVRTATFKQIELIEGGFNVSNFNLEYFDKYEVYLWKWNDTSKKSSWSKEYKMQGTTMLVNVENIDGFLIGLFPKNYVIVNLTAWDTKVIKQSNDIKGETLKSGFYDASIF